ncbi:hypothetical protein [Methylovulum psychrotolerans]|uniref:Uncharacterized protein n=1 Tax=Methylovulum psychrotolerans TaxID=1704499 RepID=A0A2S5CGN7_9GAMM|nr:hypothetical protein [Methylovulum psychrotolerans]POZ49902.1 hypothetical protein AADEFJLK_04348 [Methylovulum psychrotolerans]
MSLYATPKTIAQVKASGKPGFYSKPHGGWFFDGEVLPPIAPIPAPEPLAVAEPAPEPLAAAEPAPEPLAVAEPAPELLAVVEPAPELLAVAEPAPELLAAKTTKRNSK